MEDVACDAVEIFMTIAEAKNLKNGEITAQGHCDTFSAAFFIRGGNGSKDRGPGLARFVVCCYGFGRYGADWGIVYVKIVFFCGRFLKEFASAMTKKLMNTNLEGGISLNYDSEIESDT